MKSSIQLMPVLALLGATLAWVDVNSDQYKANYLAVFGRLPSGSNGSLPAADNRRFRVKANLKVSMPSPSTCFTDSDEDGECVPNYLCDQDTSAATTDGTGLIDIRIEGPCENYLDVCCPASRRRESGNPVTARPPREETQRTGCGWRNPRGVDMRTTGETQGETKFGEFPWMVAILKRGAKGKSMYSGGGSLIDYRVVLTAAHYVHSVEADKLTVRAGEWDFKNTREIYPYQDRNVENVVVHEHFNSGNMFYDIALVFLKEPVDPARHIGLACLPQLLVETEPGTRCFATGWGKDKFNGTFQLILKKIDVPVVSRSSCLRTLRRTRLGRNFRLHDSFMCAGGEPGRDACKGDGGSPLVCPTSNEPDRFIQKGIVSWGIGCGTNNLPGVYIDVSLRRLWIDAKMREHGIEDFQYDKY